MLDLDLTNPKHLIPIIMCSALVLSVGILYLASPFWIQKIDIDGKVVRSWTLILNYSLTITLLCGLAALIASSKKEVKKEEYLVNK